MCRKEARNWDWVYLVNVCYEGLEEVTCELGEGEANTDCDCFAGWWECVRDAVREGWCCKGKGKGKSKSKRGGGREREEMLILRCEIEGKEVASEVLKC